MEAPVGFITKEKSEITVQIQVKICAEGNKEDPPLTQGNTASNNSPISLALWAAVWPQRGMGGVFTPESFLEHRKRFVREVAMPQNISTIRWLRITSIRRSKAS